MEKDQTISMRVLLFVVLSSCKNAKFVQLPALS